MQKKYQVICNGISDKLCPSLSVWKSKKNQDGPSNHVKRTLRVHMLDYKTIS